MRLPGIRLRTMMIGVAALALVLWPAATAIRVGNDRGSRKLLHLWRRDIEVGRGAGEFAASYCHDAPFFPRFWRQLLGLSWPGSYACDHGPICDYKDGFTVTIASPVLYAEQAAEIARINAEAFKEWERVDREMKGRRSKRNSPGKP